MTNSITLVLTIQTTLPSQVKIEDVLSQHHAFQ